MTIPRDLPDMLADLYRRIGEVERRARNRRRTGTIAEVDHDAGAYRVQLSDQDGAPYLSPWIRPRQLAAGAVKVDVLLAVGEQVDVVSESGDLTDAMIELSAYSDANPRQGGAPLAISVGEASILVADGSITITAGTVRIAGDLVVEGSALTHNGTNVGDDHKHTGVAPGPALTGPPS